MTQWRLEKLGTLADLKNGLNFSAESWGRGLKIIGVSDFGDRIFPDYESLDEINPSGVARDQDMLEEDDILFVRSNGNRQLIGRCMHIRGLREPVSHSGFTIRMRFKRAANVHVPFFVYLFRSDLIRQVLSDFGGGTNINNLNQGILENLSVPVPDRDEQRKIAAIVSAYDDLIANNQRRIALLEGMAEEIYREWFVRMRFPGWQSAPMVGRLPAGWELKPLSEAVQINPTERIEQDDDTPFVSMDRLSTSSMYFRYDEKRRDATGSKFRNGDSLLPRITPCLENGKRGLVSCLGLNEVGVGSTEFIVLRPKRLGPEHVYFLSIDQGLRKHAEISMTGASGRQRVKEDCLDYFLVAVPPPEVADRFSETVGPMCKEVFVLAAQSQALARTRDALLPRLISGKLKVDHLDIRLPPSMHAEANA